jgi:DNA relaxase NicK
LKFVVKHISRKEFKMSEVTKLGTNIDWLTVTTKSDDVGQRLYRILTEFKGTHVGKKEEWKEQQFYGYQGWGSSRLFWGAHNKNGFILQLKGYIADVYFPEILDPLSRVTRVDVATTIEFDKPVLRLGEKHYNKMLKAGLMDRKLTTILNSSGGNTLYIGSRNSDQFGRIYDKGAQQGEEPGWKWRYEVELKKPRSMPSVQMFRKILLHNGTGQRTQNTLTDWVHEWFLTRGVKPPWGCGGMTRYGKVEVDYGETSVDRKLSWIRSAVRPSVEFLRENGHLVEVIEALGLTAEQLTIDGAICSDTGEVL